MKNNSIFFTQKSIEEIRLESQPEYENGFDWEKHENFEVLGENTYYDAGIIKIDTIIESLQELKSKGANYAAIDWHCDHQEMEIYGVEFRPSTKEEINKYEADIRKEKKQRKEEEIKRLEKQLEQLKK